MIFKTNKAIKTGKLNQRSYDGIIHKRPDKRTQPNSINIENSLNTIKPIKKQIPKPKNPVRNL